MSTAALFAHFVQSLKAFRLTSPPQKRRGKAALILLAVACLAPWSPAPGRGQSAGEPTDTRRYLLELKRSQAALRDARTNLERVQKLTDQGLLSHVELDRAEAGYAGAEINFQESLLSLMNVQPRISVRRAVKQQRGDGKRIVTLTLVNETPGLPEEEIRLLSGASGLSVPIPEALKTRTVRDVFVSLKGTGGATATAEATGRGTTVALPYEARIPELRYGAAQELHFSLIRDVDSVTVAISFAGIERDIDVALEQAETSQALEIGSTQISQEADLGSQATFDLRLERSGVDESTYQLAALNLPREVNYSFIDSANEARVSQISFPAGVTSRKLGLRIFLPERAGESVKTDEPIKFFVIALEAGQASRFTEARAYTLTEIEAAHAGRVALQVIPRGVGKISVDAPTLSAEIESGGQAHLEISVRNTGSRRLSNVEVQADAIPGWTIAITPKTIESLEVSGQQPVSLRATPGASVPAGDYEIRLRTESFAFNRRVPSEDKIFRVTVKSPSNLAATLGLVLLIALLLAGVAVVAVKAARR